MYRKIKITGIKFKKNLKIVKKNNLEFEIEENLSKNVNNLSIDENSDNNPACNENISENEDHSITIYIVYIVNTKDENGPD